MNALPEDAKAWVEEHLLAFVDSAVDRIVPPCFCDQRSAGSDGRNVQRVDYR